jgi:hypothetical protein
LTAAATRAAISTNRFLLIPLINRQRSSWHSVSWLSKR